VGAQAQLDRYLEVGGNLIDTADVYSRGESEHIIGRWLAARSGARDQIVLATKGRFATAGQPNDIGLSRRHLGAALDASLRRLGVDTIDLYQLHSFDPLTPLDETLRFLDDAVRAGKIHYVGLSNFTGWQLQRAVDLAEFRGWSRPVILQPQYNLLVREIEWEIIPAAQQNGLGLLPWSPLGGGWLTGKYRRDAPAPAGSRMTMRPEPYEHLLDDRVYDGLEELERRGDPATLAVAWLLADPRVTAVVVGPRRPDHLRPALDALGLPVERDVLSRLFE
jgi:aryl-alcohol dehydrogenase (NADP+)